MDEDRVALLEGRVKEIKYLFEELESGVEIESTETRCYLNELVNDQEDDRKRIGRVEKRVTELEVHFVEIEDEGNDKGLVLLEKRVVALEERVVVLEAQNVELRDHHNLLIDNHNVLVDKLNAVTALLSKEFINKEPADAAQSSILNPLYRKCTICIRVNRLMKKDGKK